MNNNAGSSGLGLSTVLTVIFVVLKLVGVIAWSWWWVLSPILIDLGLTLIVAIIYAIYLVHDSKKNEFTYFTKKDKSDKWKF